MQLARDDDPLTRRLVFLGKALKERFERMLAEHDCTLPTWAVLRYAHAGRELSQVQLAGLIGIEGPTLTRHLDRLCAEGLVSRQRDERDRRIVRVALTPAGEQRWNELHDVAHALEAKALRLLSDEQRATLDTAINAITTAMEDAHAHA
jgi:MarR family transcriptional regulator for hemolysin